MQDAIAQMNSHGLYPDHLIADGKIHRFKIDQSDSGVPGWYSGYENKTSSGQIYYVFAYGNWKTGLSEVYKPNMKFSLKEQDEIKKQIKESKRKADKEKEKDQLEIAQKLRWEWEHFKYWIEIDTDNEYLKKKQIKASSNLKSRLVNNDAVIYIPLTDINGDIWSFQKIWPDGSKRFETGAKAKGSFYAIGEFKDKINICEGFATGCSIHEATDEYVVCALSASNLSVVAQSLKEKYPDAEYLIWGDDDQFNQTNPGKIEAQSAANILKCKVVFPEFSNLESKPTDFNDLHVLEGLEKVEAYAQIENYAHKEEVDGGYQPYLKFFDKHLVGAKKDIISKRFLKLIHGLWQEPINNLDAIKSYAEGQGLKANKVQIHFDRYVLEKPFEPLIDIPKWDGRDRVKELGQFVKFKGHDYAVFEDAFKEWLANIFRRLYQEGAQNRCIILKGDQGLGKDNLIKNLLSKFDCYYSKFTGNKDDRAIWDQVCGHLISHIEEFDQTGSLTVAFLKDMITRDYVTYRSSYGRSNITRKCHASFISTVNIDAILRDETGNRRFAVFEIEGIDWEYPKDWSEQIVAQAYALYEANYKAKEETWKAVMLGNAKFEQVDMVPELLGMWDERLFQIRIWADKNNEFRFNDVHGVINDLAKASNWKPKTILTMLKSKGRSRHTKKGARYTFIDPSKDEGINEVERVVTNFVTGERVSIKSISADSDRSLNEIDHSIGHHLSIENDVPF